MKKAAVVVLLLAGVAAVAGEAGIMDGFGNFVADVQAEDELPDNEKAQNESEEVTGEEEDSASKIDTSITIGTGSRIAVVSKATDGEYWKLVRQGMEDAVKDINKAYEFSSDDEISMTFEGPSDEQDIETQVNTLDAVIAENPTVLCMSAGDIESCHLSCHNSQTAVFCHNPCLLRIIHGILLDNGIYQHSQLVASHSIQ